MRTIKKQLESIMPLQRKSPSPPAKMKPRLRIDEPWPGREKGRMIYGVDKFDNFLGLAEIVGECVRKLLESGFKLSPHCAEVGKNGSLLFVRISQSGEDQKRV